MSDWKCEIKNWDKITLETAHLFFAQAEKMLESTNDVNGQLISKSHKIIMMSVPLISLVSGYFLSLIRDKEFSSVESVSCIVFIVSLAICLFYSLKVWKPKTEYFKGSRPRNLMNPEFIRDDNQQTQTLQILFSECHSFETRIDANIRHNLTYSKILSKAIWWFILSPFIALATYAIVIFLSQIHQYRFL